MKKLYLLPNLLSSTSDMNQLPKIMAEILPQMDGLFIESTKGVGQLFKQLGITKNIREWSYFLLNEHTSEKDLLSFLTTIPENETWAIISDAGLPAIADPGSFVVRFAHQHQIQIIPIGGPSSILMALMASGLTGQRFCFHGYLPRNENERIKMIQNLERESSARNMTQIFIETPYRNRDLLKTMLKTLSDQTLLSIGSDITGENEQFKTLLISDARKTPPHVSDNDPAVFLFLA